MNKRDIEAEIVRLMGEINHSEDMIAECPHTARKLVLKHDLFDLSLAVRAWAWEHCDKGSIIGRDDFKPPHVRVQEARAFIDGGYKKLGGE